MGSRSVPDPLTPAAGEHPEAQGLLPALLERVLRQAAEEAQAERGLVIFQLRSRLEVAAEVLRANGQLDFQMRETALPPTDIAASAVRQVSETRQTAIIPGPELHGPGKPVLCLPLVSLGELVGMLYLEGSVAAADFSPGAVALVEALARETAAALEHARLVRNEWLAEERFRTIFRSSPTPMTLSRAADGVILDVNDITLAASGYRREEMVGRTSIELGIMDAESRQKLVQAIREHGSVRNMELATRLATGDLRHSLISSQPLNWGGERCFLTTGNDITELKMAEAQLRQAQKMEAIGRLAGGVAHDFNNLLTVIIGYSRLLLNRLEEANPLHEFASEIAAAGDRAAVLTRQLLVHSRKQPEEVVPHDLNAIVSGMREMLVRLIGGHVSLLTELDPHLNRVRVDRGRLEQIIMNLVVNARDAMPEVGSITIETRNASSPPSLRGVYLKPDSGPYVLLVVRDTGTGMSPEVRAKLFEPFFTTKESGKGTGLGLSVVYGIVERYGGGISVESELGHGTSISVLLPVASQQGPPEAPLSVPVPARPRRVVFSGREIIVLADDDLAVRRFAAAALGTAGYTILEAGDGSEALAIIAREGSRIDLVVSDLMMPKAGGKGLLEELRRTIPGLPVLLVSGFSEATPEGLDAPLLPKPFTAEQLVAAVRATLDHRGTGNRSS